MPSNNVHVIIFHDISASARFKSLSVSFLFEFPSDAFKQIHQRANSIEQFSLLDSDGKRHSTQPHFLLLEIFCSSIIKLCFP